MKLKITIIYFIISLFYSTLLCSEIEIIDTFNILSPEKIEDVIKLCTKLGIGTPDKIESVFLIMPIGPVGIKITKKTSIDSVRSQELILNIYDNSSLKMFGSSFGKFEIDSTVRQYECNDLFTDTTNLYIDTLYAFKYDKSKYEFALKNISYLEAIKIFKMYLTQRYSREFKSEYKNEILHLSESDIFSISTISKYMEDENPFYRLSFVFNSSGISYILKTKNNFLILVKVESWII